MVFREKLTKKYSMKTIFKVMVEDFRKLEIGVEVKFPMTRKVKLGISCYSSDNLEASVVGGFSGCFSSRDICRVCHIQHHQLDTQIHDVHGTMYGFWSVEEYDEIIRSARLEAVDVDDEGEVSTDINQENLFTEFDSGDSESADSDIVEDEEVDILQTRGLKIECPLNVLESFHCVDGFPFDIMHDMFEGKV